MTEPDVRQIISLAPTDLSLSEKLDSLPTRPGVYQFRSADGKTLYIGKAANLRSRVRQYFHKSLAAGPRIQAMVAKIADVELIMTDTEVEALILESNLIKQLRPRYNVVLKDDKGYPYIIVTKEPFPRVFVTRRRIPDAGRYFGPYTDVTTMRFALKTIRGIFLVRSCNFEMNEQTIAARKFKVCLDYHIKKCDGPCEGHISQEQYGAMIRQVESVLEGRTRLVVEGLRSDMTRAADELRFEDAARLRDRIKALDVYIDKQSVIDESDESRDMIAVASRDDDACGVLFRVREGKVIGSRHYYIAQAESSTGPELLKALLQRIYAEEEDLPALIITGEDPDDAAALTDWLTTRRRTPMRIERAPEGPWETQTQFVLIPAP
ncbi:MAG: excinuclease ABC subunit UvrC, partial [Bacteroidetes bacterium]|nr:excinuclease ABC subunit UvrC [Bacteroidota bacterium]